MRRLGIATVLIFLTAPFVFAQHPAPHIPVPRAYSPPIYHAPIYRPYVSPVSPYRGAGARTLSHPWWPIYPFPRRFFPVGPNSFFIQPYWYLWSTWAYNACGWTNCYLDWSLGLNNTLPFYARAPAYAPVQNYIYYGYYGEQRSDLPQLVLTDGSVYSVSDYWLVDKRLHFIPADSGARQPEEQVIPVEDLDLQATIDVNSRRGFRFVLRNEPIEQYLHDHPNDPPPPWPAPNERQP